MSNHGTHARPGADALSGHQGHGSADGAKASGLASAEGGLRIDGRPAIAPAGEELEFAFAIFGSDGHPLTSFDELHERRMHLIVVRRDLTGFQHLHPEMSEDGMWRVDLTLPTGGAWRAFADFQTGGVPSTLGMDVLVDGYFRPKPLPEASATAEAGSEVVSLVPAQGGSRLHFTVMRGGRRIDVEPYLGAAGHLVALRWGDLAFLHVHPISEEDIAFEVSYPGPGTYRLFLQYSVDGEVRTAAFTTSVS